MNEFSKVKEAFIVDGPGEGKLVCGRGWFDYYGHEYI